MAFLRDYDDDIDRFGSQQELAKIPDPENWGLAEHRLLSVTKKADYYEDLGGTGYSELYKLERKFGYKGCNLEQKRYDHEQQDGNANRRNWYPNSRWMEKILKRKVNSVKAEKAVYRKIYAAFRLICKIEDIARRLVDKNVINKCHIFYHILIYDKTEMVKYADYVECWKSLLESSEVPLCAKLKRKLKDSKITKSEFSKGITKIYLNLLRFSKFEYFQTEPARRKDIISVLTSLHLSDRCYKSVQILFNLDEPKEFRI